MRKIKVAAIQASFGKHTQANVEKVTHFVERAAKEGARLILPSELFENIYFCYTESDEYFALAKPALNHPTVQHFQKVAKAFGVYIPVSFFEKDGPHYYNSLAFVNSDGSVQGYYRKSHIPDGPGYEEKFYFRPGDTGFKVWKTDVGNVGVGICWDQWFPECARIMTLQGAEILFYPTAIGTEPENPDLDTSKPWQRAMIGHAVSNVVPVVAANRIGKEEIQSFYGHSFIVDHRGDMIAEMDSQKEGIISAEFDLDEIEKNRASFGFFRDRRRDLYESLLRK